MARKLNATIVMEAVVLKSIIVTEVATLVREWVLL
jgi:hypothetical protein